MPVNVRGMDNTIVFLENFESRMGSSVFNIVTKFGMDLYGSIVKMSPVGEVHGGRFRGDWQFDVSSSPRSLVIFTIFNRMPYAGPVSYGSVVGKAPWPSAGPRTVENAGRVYSSQAPFGVVEPAFNSLPIDKLRNEILRALT